jgi:hemolysin activation/secretion protein
VVGAYNQPAHRIDLRVGNLHKAMVLRHWSRACIVSVLLCCLGAVGQANAQTVAPSQVTPPTLRPAPGPGAGVIIPEAAGLQAPSGADRISVTVRRVSVSGAFDDMADATRQLARTVQGRRLTVLQIYQAAQAYEAAYAQAGYILVRIAVPPQQLQDGGTLRLLVIDGFIESVDVRGVPERVRGVVASRTNTLIGKRRIKLGEIERRLLLAGDAPGLRLRSTLARGTSEGGAKLILEGIYRPVTGSLGADNRLPSTLGVWSYNASLALNSVLGLGEQFYGSLIGPFPIGDTFESDARIRVFGAGAVIPIGVDGWTVNPEYTLSRTRPVATLGTPDNIAWFERWAVRTSYPLIRERVRAIVLQGSFEAIKQYTDLIDFGTELNRDEYTVLRGGADIGFPLPWAGGPGMRTSFLFSRGLGGRDAADAAATGIPLTRLGASPVFSKLTGDVRLFQPLPQAFQIVLIGRGQTTFNSAVLRSEQFALDAVDGVSSFPTGTFTVDEGVSGRAELMRPFDWRTADFSTTLIPYVFGATGRGYLRMPTAVEPSSMRASSVGVGMRVGLEQLTSLTGFSAGVEFGKQYSDFPGLAVGYRTTAILLLRF